MCERRAIRYIFKFTVRNLADWITRLVRRLIVCSDGMGARELERSSTNRFAEATGFGLAAFVLAGSVSGSGSVAFMLRYRPDSLGCVAHSGIIIQPGLPLAL